MEPNYTKEIVRDLDGNSYHVVRIGMQEWFIENLKTIRYRNGDMIGTTIPATKKFGLFDLKPKYQWSYQGKEEYVERFGRLYTWYAATDPRGIAPKGWRIPSKADWDRLLAFLQNNGYHYGNYKHEIGKSLASKEIWGKGHLTSFCSDIVANNFNSNSSSGFTAQPGGYRTNLSDFEGSFHQIIESGWWWSSSESLLNKSEAIAIQLSCRDAFPQYFDCEKHCGMSIRCLRDM